VGAGIHVTHQTFPVEAARGKPREPEGWRLSLLNAGSHMHVPTVDGLNMLLVAEAAMFFRTSHWLSVKVRPKR